MQQLKDRIAVSEQEAADLIGLSRDTLRRYRRQNCGPRYVRVGGPNGPIRYRPSDLDDWVSGQSVGSRSEELAR